MCGWDDGLYILPEALLRFRKLPPLPKAPGGLSRSIFRLSCSWGLSLPSLLGEEYPSLGVAKGGV